MISRRISIRPTGRLILFVLLSVFLVAQVSWWVVYQTRTADRVAALQEEVWAQEARVAVRLLDQHESLPADSQAVFVRTVFPDLTIDPRTGDVHVSPSARQRLARETTDVARMFGFESATFVVIIFAGMLYMYATLRREIAVERQYGNFLAAVTHELRSPVAALRLLQESVRDPDLTVDQRARVLAQMNRSLDRLQGLIDRLLRTRELADGRPRRRPRERFDLRAETERALRDMATSRPEMETRVHVELASLHSRGDPEGWRILVTNLVENALKYSNSNQPVTVTLAPSGTEACLTVRDEGVGFARSERRKMFRRFYRVGDEDRRGSEGSGLGLYLVREVVRAMRGRVTADSPGPGKGAVFTVTVPTGG